MRAEVSQGGSTNQRNRGNPSNSLCGEHRPIQLNRPMLALLEGSGMTSFLDLLAGPGGASLDAGLRARIDIWLVVSRNLPPTKGEHRPIQLNRAHAPHKGNYWDFPRFPRFFGLSWETSTLNNYHPEDPTKHSGSRRIEFSSKSVQSVMDGSC